MCGALTKTDDCFEPHARDASVNAYELNPRQLQMDEQGLLYLKPVTSQDITVIKKFSLKGSREKEKNVHIKHPINVESIFSL